MMSFEFLGTEVRIDGIDRVSAEQTREEKGEKSEKEEGLDRD